MTQTRTVENREGLVEMLATVICDWQEPGRFDALANEPPTSSAFHQEHFRMIARLQLAAIEASGLAVVPAEPTEEMREAAKDDRAAQPDGLPPGVAMAQMYKAMLSSSPFRSPEQ